MDSTNHQNKNNITSPNQLLEDINSDKSLRPLSFNDFIGQDKIIENLKVYIEAAKKATELGLGINAGHDLSLENLEYFAKEIPNLEEFDFKISRFLCLKKV